MGSFSLVHWLVVLVIVLVLFGRGRISEIMGDFGKGIKSFKQGVTEEEKTPAAPPPAQIPPQTVVTPEAERTETGDVKP
jgi:sec-independent protein translocase protein TatA